MPDNLTPDQIEEATMRGFIRALQSPEAEEAVNGAITAWFDKQSGKAMRSLFHSLLVGVLLLLAVKADSFKAAVVNWLK
jgi:hypothetical protein